MVLLFLVHVCNVPLLADLSELSACNDVLESFVQLSLELGVAFLYCHCITLSVDSLSNSLELAFLFLHVAFSYRLVDDNCIGVSVLKLVIIPIASIITGSLMGIDSTVNTVIAVSSACPVAAISAIFAAEFELDTPYASGVVAATTVLSIISLPLIVLIF